ncbi:MAG: tyrosine-protein phosphatase [Clostridia bacterium]|nr:tyrosine-protein phosphatase [Clostridia bacterium]
MNKIFVRLPLEGAENVRELGGYPTNDGKVTKFGVFLRGSYLSSLTKNDNDFLYNYGDGVRTVIDLRSEDKSFENPDAVDNRFTVKNVSLLTDKFNENLVLEKKNFNMGDGYIYILQNTKAIKEIFDIIAESKGCTLIHCTAGKDRTGIISMLILGICNVSSKDIIANYKITDEYFSALIDPELGNPDLALSKPEYIKCAMKYIEDNFGTYYDYLKSCGISDETINKIKNKFLD